MIYVGKTSLKEIFAKLKGYFAPIDSPALTGTPTAPTPADNAGGTQIATVDYVKAHSGGTGEMQELTAEEINAAWNEALKGEEA